MTTNRLSADGYRTLRLLGALLGLSVTLGACQETSRELVMANTPDDYRFRHPIAIEEANQSAVIFVGHGRGGLTADQHAEVIGVGQSWRREATGAIVADVPVDTPNAVAAADAFREVRSLLASAGVPSRAITVHHYHPDNPRLMPTIRLTYTRIAADAGPCGVWPADLGPSINDPDYADNRQYHNSAAPRSATLPRWSTIPPTWCNRAPKRPPIPRGVRKASRNTARVTRRRPITPSPKKPNSAMQANDQRA